MTSAIIQSQHFILGNRGKNTQQMIHWTLVAFYHWLDRAGVLFLIAHLSSLSTYAHREGAQEDTGGPALSFPFIPLRLGLLLNLVLGWWPAILPSFPLTALGSRVCSTYMLSSDPSCFWHPFPLSTAPLPSSDRILLRVTPTPPNKDGTMYWGLACVSTAGLTSPISVT